MTGRAAACACVCSSVLLLVAACGLDAVGTGEALGESAASSGSSSGGTSSARDDASFVITDDGSTSSTDDAAVDVDAGIDAGPISATLRIRVGIDGQSYFLWKGTQAHWHQTTYAAPARHPDTPLPLELNMQTFNPTWPDTGGDTQNYSCNCDSSAMTVPSPPLPAKAQTVALQVVAARKSITIAEQPSAANNYQLSVFFDDVGFGGSSYYEAVLTYDTR